MREQEQGFRGGGRPGCVHVLLQRGFEQWQRERDKQRRAETWRSNRASERASEKGTARQKERQNEDRTRGRQTV
eukprot:1174333-Rhodomonas_salina.1